MLTDRRIIISKSRNKDLPHIKLRRTGKAKTNMTVDTLEQDARVGEIVGTFRLPRDGSLFDITKVPASELGADPDDSRHHADTYVIADHMTGAVRLAIGVQDSERWGTLVGLAPLGETGSVEPDLLMESVGDVLQVAHVAEAMIPPEANGVGREALAAIFGGSPNYAGMFAVHAAARAA